MFPTVNILPLLVKSRNQLKDRNQFYIDIILKLLASLATRNNLSNRPK